MSMTTDFSKGKTVNQETEDTVCGFIRGCRAELPPNNPYFDIPRLVIYECILYYRIDEWFSEYHGDLIQVSDDNMTASMKEGADESEYHTIFGHVPIDFCGHFVYEWTIKIIKCPEHDPDDVDSDYEIAIGISMKTAEKGENHMMDSKGDTYCFHRGGRKESSNGIDSYCTQKYGQNDTLKMSLDTKDKTLRYYLNDVDLGTAFKVECADDITLFMAVSMRGNKHQDKVVANNSVQIIDFQSFKKN